MHGYSCFLLFLIAFVFFPLLQAIHLSPKMLESITLQLPVKSLLAFPPILLKPHQLTLRVQNYFEQFGIPLYPSLREHYETIRNNSPRLAEEGRERFTLIRDLLAHYGYVPSGKKDLDMPMTTNSIKYALTNLFKLAIAEDPTVGNFYRIFRVRDKDVFSLAMTCIGFYQSLINVLPPRMVHMKALTAWLDYDRSRPIPEQERQLLKLNKATKLAPYRSMFEVVRQVSTLYALPWTRDYVKLDESVKSPAQIFVKENCDVKALRDELSGQRPLVDVEHPPINELRRSSDQCMDFNSWLTVQT